MNKIDWNLPLVTKDGRKAEYCRLLNTSSEYKRLVVLTDSHGWESHETYTEDGHLLVGDQSALDLINAPPPKVRVKLQGIYRVFGPFKDKEASRGPLFFMANAVVTTFSGLEVEVE